MNKNMFEKTVYDIFDKLEEGIYIIDKNGIIQYINSKALQIERVEKKDIIGMHLLDVYPTLSENNSTLLRVIKSKKPILNFTQRYRNYKGEELTTVNSSYPIFEGRRIKGAVEILRDITAIKKLENEVKNLKDEVELVNKEIIPKEKTAYYDFINIIGRSESILRCKERAVRAAKTTSPILVYGETGTGKELLVQAIHNNSYRRNKVFMAQNCAAIPANLMESMLFGTVKGSFTGSENRKGIFELADGGTLYLDELNSMPIELQSKLLRVLQEGKIRKVGDTELKTVDVRIIASLNEEPETLIDRGELRSDLYYRLNVVRIDIPPLRERKEDIPALVQSFINKYNNKFNAAVNGISKDALDTLFSLEWDGNIRELEHAIEAVFNIKSSGVITSDDFDEVGLNKREMKEFVPLKQKLEELEKNYINEALALSDNNISKAAKILDIPRQTLQYKIKKIKKI